MTAAHLFSPQCIVHSPQLRTRGKAKGILKGGRFLGFARNDKGLAHKDRVRRNPLNPQFVIRQET
ncbi:MAG: hypothetical protein LBL66_01760 [Clostridiales bacterium]|nr:hypothetical protein [Clostridiales bacterium]